MTITDPDALTPVEQRAGFWLKRDDLFEFAGVRGGKVRSCLRLSQGASGLITASARKSPQQEIVSSVAREMGIPCRIHAPQGAETQEMTNAMNLGAEYVRHKAAYNNVICARAREDAAESGWREIPFGMECRLSVEGVRKQTKNLPLDGLDRIVVPVGSGICASGVLWGLLDRKLRIPVLGILVGQVSREKRMNRWAPPWWREQIKLVPASVPYATSVEAEIDGMLLDPIYEAKCREFLEPGDLFWIVGCRRSVLGDNVA